jgi:VWFA-related protein
MRKTGMLFIGLLLVLAFALANQQPPTIRLDVNLVQVSARVTDRDGHPVSGLSKEAFQLFVDNLPQAISVFQGEDAPVTAGIVVDNSASMAPKRKEVIAAARAFAGASNPKDEMFVVHFNNRVRYGLPEGNSFTGSISELEKAISAFDLGGTTAFYDALLSAISHLHSAAYPRKVLLTITDGGDNSSRATLAEVIDTAVKAGTVMYPIGIFDENNRDRNPDVLQQLAKATGGEAYFPRLIADITDTCILIARNIREQYTIGFAGAEDGRYHEIRLIVTDPKAGKLHVETQPGYFAHKPQPTRSSHRRKRRVKSM